MKIGKHIQPEEFENENEVSFCRANLSLRTTSLNSCEKKQNLIGWPMIKQTFRLRRINNNHNYDRKVELNETTHKK